MNSRNAALTYRQSAFENAPPIKIVRLLYEGAIRYIERAAGLLADGNQPSWTYWVGRADAIVEELRVSLDPTHGEELCRELDRLYEFVQNRLSAAVVESDPVRLEEARSVLERLLSGWSQVETQTSPAVLS